MLNRSSITSNNRLSVNEHVSAQLDSCSRDLCELRVLNHATCVRTVCTKSSDVPYWPNCYMQVRLGRVSVLLPISIDNQQM